jgi:hypothetical protein
MKAPFTPPIYMYHHNWNKIAIIHHNGIHRVYKENKRSDTTLYLNRIGQLKVKYKLESFGYKQVTEEIFNHYFKTK